MDILPDTPRNKMWMGGGGGGGGGGGTRRHHQTVSKECGLYGVSKHKHTTLLVFTHLQRKRHKGQLSIWEENVSKQENKRVTN